MKQFLNNLNEREKWLLIGTAIALSLYSYYLILYAPLSTKVTQKSAQLIEKTQTLSWMKQIKGQVPTTKKKQAIDNSQLLTMLAAQLKEHISSEFPYQLQQTSTGDIQLTFDAVPFNLLLQWLAKINESYTITIKQFEASHTDKPGVTKLMIILAGS